jgi:hypothetical protein
MAKQNTARKRSTNPQAKPKKVELAVVPETTESSSEQNPRRRRKRRRNWGGRRKNMSTGAKIAIGVGIVAIGVPLVIMTVGAIMVAKIANKAIDDMPINQPPTGPIYPGAPGIPS